MAELTDHISQPSRESYPLARDEAPQWLSVSCALCHAPIFAYPTEDNSITKFSINLIVAPLQLRKYFSSPGKTHLHCPICEIPLAHKGSTPPENDEWEIIIERTRQTKSDEIAC